MMKKKKKCLYSKTLYLYYTFWCYGVSHLWKKTDWNLNDKTLQIPGISSK